MNQWWKLHSVQIMAFWAALGGVIVAMWPVAHYLLDKIIPDGPWRIGMAALVSAVTFGSMLYARTRPQPKLTGNG